MMVVVGIIITGCGQNATDTQYVSAANNNITVVGRVYETGMDLTQKPITGAIVSLIGKDTKTVTSISDGSYSFSGIASGQYTFVVTKEGYQTYWNGPYSYVTSYETYAYMQNINMKNQPIILSITPSNGAIVPASLATITVEFNEPMDTTSVYGYVNYNRISAAGLSAAGLSGTTNSWSNNNRTLTITLSEPLTKEGMYNLYLVGPDGGYSTIRDASKNTLDSTTYSSDAIFTCGYVSTPQGDNVAIITNFFTSTVPVVIPGKPTGLRVFDQNGSEDIDYSDVYAADSKSIILNWEGTAEATMYKVYGSCDGGPYQQLYITGYGYNPINATGASLVVGDIKSSITNMNWVTDGSYPIDPGTPWPFLGSGISLEVAAVTAFGETRSDPITAKDNVMPHVNSATIVVGSGNTLIDITFTEPLDRGAAENVANYVVAGGVIVTKAVLTNNYMAPSATKVRLTIDPGVAHGTVTVQSGVTDLSGNMVDPDFDTASW